MHRIITGKAGTVMKRVGIMGGTFNPIHYAHLILAEHAFWQFALDEVVFIPSKKPAHKPVDYLASDEHRFAMIQNAIADNPHFTISAIEYEREGNTYTVDTLELLKADHPDIEYYFILGGDSLINFESWLRYERILELCHVVAAMRGEYDLDRMKEKADELNNQYQSDIKILNIPGMDVSSRMIRERIQNKQTVRYLLPETVIAYIYEHNIYKD